jgi:general stress protein YciG
VCHSSQEGRDDQQARHTDRETAMARDQDHAQVPGRKRGPQPGSEAARRRGTTTREKYGPDFYSRIGTKGGQAMLQTRGPEYYARIGQKGGKMTRDRHGLGYYERIGKLGGSARKHQRAHPGD